jgi:hypothetical protein
MFFLLPAPFSFIPQENVAIFVRVVFMLEKVLSMCMLFWLHSCNSRLPFSFVSEVYFLSPKALKNSLFSIVSIAWIAIKIPHYY